MLAEAIRFLGVFALALIVLVLLTIVYNALKRCQIQAESEQTSNEKYVDLFISNLCDVPKSGLSPGTSFLIDQGMISLETGVYVFRGYNAEPTKVSVPFVGEKYRILSGDFAGHVHTVRQQFVEIRPPSDQQIFDNKHIVQTLQDTTKYIVIHEDVSATCQLATDETKTIFRRLEIVNFSKHDLIVLVRKQEYIAGPGYAGVLYFNGEKGRFLNLM